MSDALSIAVSGLNNAAMRVESAASNIVNSSSTIANGKKFAGTSVVSEANVAQGQTLGVSSRTENRAEGSQIDVASEMVDMQTASLQYQANAKVVGVVDRMHKKLLDEIA